MKTMIYSLALTALLLPLGSCSDDDSPVLTQKDWDGTATYFASTDEMTSLHIISRTWDMWATRCRSMIRWHRIQGVISSGFRPNPETYHPIWE